MGEGLLPDRAGQLPIEELQPADMSPAEVVQGDQWPQPAVSPMPLVTEDYGLPQAEQQRPPAILARGEWLKRIEQSKQAPAHDTPVETPRAATAQRSGLQPPGKWFEMLDDSKRPPVTGREPVMAARATGYRLPSDEAAETRDDTDNRGQNAVENSEAAEADVRGEQAFSGELERASESLHGIEAQLQAIAEDDTVNFNTLAQYRDELSGLLTRLGDAAGQGPWQANYLHGYPQLRTDVSGFMDRVRVAITEVEQRQQSSDQGVMNREPYEGRVREVSEVMGRAKNLLEPLRRARDLQMLRTRFNGTLSMTDDRYTTVDDALGALQQLQTELAAAAESSKAHHTAIEVVRGELPYWKTKLGELKDESDDGAES